MQTITISPRVSETDAVGHINNTTIPVWLEAGRQWLFKLFNPDDNFNNWHMVIVKTEVEYKHQIYYGKEVKIKNSVSRIGNSSLELYEEIHQDNHLCIVAKATYVNFNTHLQKSEKISLKLREELMKHMI